MPPFKKIVIFGVGLIGGSFALALKKAGVVEQVVGVGRRLETLERAQSLGIIDMIGDVTAVSGADLVLIATPVAQTQAVLASIAPYLQAHTVVTDAGSTKSDVVAAALADLYVGKKVVLTALPENASTSVASVSAAWKHCGALIHELSAEEHDAVFAAVSHLPHLLAYALVDDIAASSKADLLFQYAASGFRDFTRIAGSSPEMWRDIALANQSALLVELDTYINQLNKMRSLLQAADGNGLQTIFSQAQTARQSWINAIEMAEQVRTYEQGGD